MADGNKVLIMGFMKIFFNELWNINGIEYQPNIVIGAGMCRQIRCKDRFVSHVNLKGKG